MVFFCLACSRGALVRVWLTVNWVDTRSVLAQARSFLPMLAAANAQLEQTLAENPGSLDIENVEEGKPYVEMARCSTLTTRQGAGVAD